MTYRMPDALTSAIIAAGSRQAASARRAAAAKAAALLRDGAPISETARRALATLLSGGFHPPAGRPIRVGDLVRRGVFRLSVDELVEREGITIAAAIARLAAQEHREISTLRRWYFGK